jgi:hypothetical protein
VLSVGPKEEALKKDPRRGWGTDACWQHLDRTSDTSTVVSTQQRCVSRRFVKFVRLCAGPSSSSSSLAVLAAALHYFRFLSRPDSLSLSVSLPPSSPDSSNFKSCFCCQKQMGGEGSHIACPRGFWQIFFLFLGSPSSSESSCSLVLVLFSRGDYWWVSLSSETTATATSVIDDLLHCLRFLGAFFFWYVYKEESFLQFFSNASKKIRRTFFFLLLVCSLFLRRKKFPSHAWIGCVSCASCSVSLFQAFKGHYSNEEALLWKLSGFQSLRPDCEARR